MASFAKVSLLGNLGADPETKYTPSGSMVVELRLAVNPRPRGQNREEAPPTWYRISAWDRLADRLDKLSQQGHIAKGRSLYVEGRLEPREYTAQDGSQRVSFDVTMTDFDFVGGGRDGDQQGRQGDGGGYRQQGGGGYQQGGGGYQQGGSYGSSRRDSFNDSDGPMTEIDDVPF